MRMRRLLVSFHSILFEKADNHAKNVPLKPPIFFADLNLDQIIDTITAGRQEYNLKPFFYTPLKDINAIKYRNKIFHDLDNNILFENIKSFTKKMRTIREHLVQSEKMYYKYQKESWFLDAMEIYCDSVNSLLNSLLNIDLESHGFLSFRKYLTDYIASDRFTLLSEEVKILKADLSKVKYCLLIKGNSIKVDKYKSEIDYSRDVEKTFDRFKQAVAKDYKVKFYELSDMNHVEGKILDLVAKLYPEIFLHLDNFCAANNNYLDKTIGIFDREVQFYIAYLEFISIIKQSGLKFCYPIVSDVSKEIYNYEGFDLALAHKLATEEKQVICNDFYLKDKERIFVVTGPNQGGKTTFARAFGQMHYLAGCGCPVQGKKAKLFIYDRFFTHFEKEENVKNLRGKLEDDLIRIYDIIKNISPNSLVIMNEIFTSTTLKDAIFLSKKVMEKMIEMDLLCVWVTFIDEMAFFGDKVVSLISTVTPENSTLRTYKILRRPADGLAYALSIAEKHQLTYEQLKERIRP